TTTTGPCCPTAIPPIALLTPTYLHIPLFLSPTPPAPPAIYTLSLHDALPICRPGIRAPRPAAARSGPALAGRRRAPGRPRRAGRSEEHTSELQSRVDLVCRLLLEKKKHTGEETRLQRILSSCRRRAAVKSRHP